MLKALKGICEEFKHETTELINQGTCNDSACSNYQHLTWDLLNLTWDSEGHSKDLRVTWDFYSKSKNGTACHRHS